MTAQPESHAERGVLGALILKGERVPEIAGTLEEDDFGVPQHRAVWGALLELSRRGEPIDFVSMESTLRASGRLQTAGGLEVLVELAGGVTGVAHLRHHASLVARAAARCRLAQALSELAARAEAPECDPVALAAESHERIAATVARLGGATLPLSEIAPEGMSWLWPGRIPLGKLTLISGDPGLGKSALTLDIAARVSTGRRWPDAPEARAEPAEVLLVSAEDDLADTIRPRLDAAGADPARVRVMRDNPRSLETDLARIEGAIAGMRECRLLVIDPLTAFLGGRDSHKDAEVRGLLTPLAELAARHRVAVLMVNHLNKAQGTRAIYRPGGSIGIVGAVRASWLIARDPEHPDRRLMVSNKANLAPDVGALAFSVEPSESDPGRPIIVWGGTVVVAADELLGSDRERASARVEAKRWLRSVLSSGPVAVAELRGRAREAGLAWRTIEAAKAKLGIESQKLGLSGWVWEIPRTEGRTVADVAVFAAFEPNGHPEGRESPLWGPQAEGRKDRKGGDGVNDAAFRSDR